MNTLMSLFRALLETEATVRLAVLVARWTVLLATAWALHAALARGNPRWRVSLWHAVAVGVCAILVLACAPPVFRWQLTLASTPAIPASESTPKSFIDAISPTWSSHW